MKSSTELSNIIPGYIFQVSNHSQPPLSLEMLLIDKRDTTLQQLRTHVLESLQVHQCTKNILGMMISKPLTRESYISATLNVTCGY